MNLNTFNENRRFSLKLHKRVSGEIFELMGTDSSIVKELTIDQQMETPVVECIVTLKSAVALNTIVEVGDLLFYYESELGLDYSIRFRLKHSLFIMKITDDENNYSKILTCRNYGHWLMRNAYYLKVNAEETTSQFIRRTATERGVPIDKIDFSPYHHSAKVIQKTSLFRAYQNLMSVTILNEQQLYNLRFSAKGLIFEKVLDSDKMWVFEISDEYANILRPSRSVSIIDPDFTNIVTSIKIEQTGTLTGGLSYKGTLTTRVNKESVALYGEFPTEINTSAFGGTPEEIEDRLQQIVDNGLPVDSIDFRTYAINSIIPTNRILVYYPEINAVGEYFVESISTLISDRNYWHDLHVIKRRNIQPELIQQLGVRTTESVGGFGEF